MAPVSPAVSATQLLGLWSLIIGVNGHITTPNPAFERPRRKRRAAQFCVSCQMITQAHPAVSSPARNAYRCSVIATAVAVAALVLMLVLPATQWFLLPAYFAVAGAAVVCGLLALSLRGAEALVVPALIVVILHAIVMLSMTVGAFSFRMGAP